MPAALASLEIPLFMFRRLTLKASLIRATGHSSACRSSSSSSFSYRHCPSEVPLLGETIGQRLSRTAKKHPSREAVISVQQNIRRTYAEFENEVDHLAAGFLRLGLQRGDRVGMWGPNSYEWVLTQFATAKAGLILVNVNPAYRPSEAEYAFNKVGCKALVSSPAFKTQNYYDILCNLAPNLPSSQPGRLQAEKIPHLETVIMCGSEDYGGAFKLEDVMQMGNQENHKKLEALQSLLQFDDPVNIQFTSGTTGNPKGATLSHHNILNNAYFVGLALGYDAEEGKVCIPVPLYHCFAMVLGVLSCIVHGVSALLPSAGFEAEATLRAVQEEKCRALYGTPTMFIDMLNHSNFRNFDMSSLRTGIMAGSPCPIEVMKRVISDMNMKEVTICYGLTETSPVTFQTSRTDPVEQKVSTIGKVHPHNEFKIVDEEGKIVEAGVTGELCTRGYTTMLGYWEDDAKTKEARTVEGWLKTGDLAVMGADGYVTIAGRKKDMVIRGGENLYPTEIEQFLYKHPKIHDVQVVGVPDERLGEELCACIVLRDGEDASCEEMRNFCKDQIAYMKVPRYVVFMDSFPVTITGKVKKYVLRDEVAKQLKGGKIK